MPKQMELFGQPMITLEDAEYAAQCIASEINLIRTDRMEEWRMGTLHNKIETLARFVKKEKEKGTYSW